MGGVCVGGTYIQTIVTPCTFTSTLRERGGGGGGGRGGEGDITCEIQTWSRTLIN